jgi:hypothetical protein
MREETITIPLNKEANKAATAATTKKPTVATYLEVLAQWVGYTYLKILQVDCQINDHDHDHHLHVPYFGKLKCIPVVPDQKCIPVNNLEGYRGIFVVRFEGKLNKGELLGFLPITHIKEHTHSLSAIYPIENFFDYFD